MSRSGVDIDGGGGGGGDVERGGRCAVIGRPVCDAYSAIPNAVYAQPSQTRYCYIIIIVATHKILYIFLYYCYIIIVFYEYTPRINYYFFVLEIYIYIYILYMTIDRYDIIVCNNGDPWNLDVGEGRTNNR